MPLRHMQTAYDHFNEHRNTLRMTTGSANLDSLIDSIQEDQFYLFYGSNKTFLDGLVHGLLVNCVLPVHQTHGFESMAMYINNVDYYQQDKSKVLSPEKIAIAAKCAGIEPKIVFKNLFVQIAYNQRHQLTVAEQVSDFLESRNQDIRLLVVNNITKYFREAKYKNYAVDILKETLGILCKVCTRNKIALICTGDANVTSKGVIPRPIGGTYLKHAVNVIVHFGEAEAGPHIRELDLEKKIILATEGIMTKFFESTLRDKLSKGNALAVADYIIAMKREINPQLNYTKSTIQFLSELSRAIGVEKHFVDMTRDDILFYLDKCRKPETEDPLHKWISSYNLKRITLMRFFKWLYYPNIASPKRRNELSLEENKPECIIGIPQLKRKEISCYKPTELWTQEDDLLFLKWVTNKRDRCYHTMARDLSARPHEILNLKIKDIIFKAVDKYQYAEVLVNGKTGTRHIPLIQSIPYIKDWLSNHPSRNNPKSPLFVGLGRRSMGRQLTVSGLYNIYKDYKNVFFPRILEDETVIDEDKDKIKALLAKPFNPYIRRHSALTEKSVKLKFNTLNQHAGWSMNSNMAQKYIHYFGNESSESLLEAYGIVTKDKIPIDTLNPKICPNCNEGNTQDAKFCSKCKMVMSFMGYQEALESQKDKEEELKAMKDQFNTMQSQMQSLITALGSMDQSAKNAFAKELFANGIYKNEEPPTKKNEEPPTKKNEELICLY